MLILYVKPGCPYATKVLEVVRAQHIPIDEKNMAEPGVAEEVRALGGKQQSPFLFDRDRNVSMYESGAIVNYLCEQYGCSQEALAEVAVHTCDVH